MNTDKQESVKRILHHQLELLAAQSLTSASQTNASELCKLSMAMIMITDTLVKCTGNSCEHPIPIK